MKQVIIACMIMIMSACHPEKTKQPSYYGESPLLLEQFDFQIDQDQFYPRKFAHPYDNATLVIPKGKHHDDDYLIGVDSVKENGSKLKWIEYYSPSFWSTDTVALLGQLDFPSISMAVGPDGDVLLVGGYFRDLDTKEQEQELLAQLSQRYGPCTKDKRVQEQSSIKNSYTWEWNNKVIRLCTVTEQGNNTLQVTVIDNEPVQVENGSPEVEAYIFVAKKENLLLLESSNMKNIPLAFFK